MLVNDLFKATNEARLDAKALPIDEFEERYTEVVVHNGEVFDAKYKVAQKEDKRQYRRFFRKEKEFF